MCFYFYKNYVVFVDTLLFFIEITYFRINERIRKFLTWGSPFLCRLSSCSKRTSTASTNSSEIAWRSASLVSTLCSIKSSTISRFSLSIAIRSADRPRGSTQLMLMSVSCAFWSILQWQEVFWRLMDYYRLCIMYIHIETIVHNEAKRILDDIISSWGSKMLSHETSLRREN